MPYIVRGDRAWSFCGTTHEYLDGDFDKRIHRTNDINFRHIGDGGSKGDKFIRDEILLKKQIALEPDSPRWIFYLAQTRMSLGDAEGAIAAFRRRTEMGGWDEEIFWSLLQIGEILDVRGDWAEASIAYITAWEYRPTRAEPLMALAAGFRSRHMYATALLYAEQGMKLVIPDDKLFMRRWVYEWGLAFEYSIASWWLGNDDIARDMWKELLERTDLKDAYRAAITSNLELLKP
jgi:tetratricopeptide (TPR) repeat protein